MKNLLVAIDFSPASRHACEYASWLSLELEGKFSVVHVAPRVKAVETVSRAQQERLQARENEALQNQLRQFATHYPDKKPEAITEALPEAFLIRNGKAEVQLPLAAKELNADMLLIGVRDKHGLAEHLFGSVSTQLIGKTGCPLLIVPQQSPYRKVRNIALALDITQEEPTITEQLRTIAGQLDAAVQPFFVNMLPEEQDKFREETLMRGEQPITMVRDRSVSAGIQYFLDRHPVEMLAIRLPKRAFPAHLFHGRLARHLAWRTPLPLLVL